MNTARRANGRSEASISQRPFIGAAPALAPMQRGPGVFSDLLNVDVYQDRLASRKPFTPAGAGLPAGDYSAAISVLMQSDSGDLALTYLPTTGILYGSMLGGSSVVSVSTGATGADCHLVADDKAAVLFSASGNRVINYAFSALSVRALGLQRFTYFGTMHNAAATSYKLYRYGIELCRKTGGVITESSSINRCKSSSKFTTYGGGAFNLTSFGLGYYDTVRFWRSMQLNVTTSSLNNVAVGSPDELYLLASFSVDSLPTVTGNSVTVGPVTVTKTAAGWSFSESAVDDDLDDTTIQTIESINLLPFPACASGCHASGRYWGVVDGGIAYSMPGGTLYRELYDPLNVLRTPGEQPAAIAYFCGDVIVFTAGGTWRVTSADPVNGIHKIASFGVSHASRLGVLDGVGIFAVCQDDLCRLLTPSLSWVDRVGGVAFSEHVGSLFSSCSVSAHCGDVYVADTTAGLWKLNLSAGCGWSRYSMGSDSFCASLLYADGASVAFLRASDRRPFCFASSEGWTDTADDDTFSAFSCVAAASLDAGRGMFELRSAKMRMHSYLAYSSSVAISATVQGQAWTPFGTAPSAAIPASIVSELEVLAPMATAYKARPVGRWMIVALTYGGGVDLYELILCGMVQESVRPGWNPLAIFAGG